ncbi:MAG TPA: SDR family NAD(P)-dependent oxidoreductase [Allosphingosinicella sp.]|nr:SDR family NAD(P)-dependent oxidoreductase [Allosphingosinicella sp.]
MSQRKFAIVTGASTGIGLELAKLAAQEGYDLLVVADTPLVDASAALKDFGVEVRSVETDLSTGPGVDRLLDAAGGRDIDLLCANAGHGLGHGFLDQAPRDWRHVIDTNITGTLLLIQRVAKEMVSRKDGKILITGSIAGFTPGAFQAVYNGSKAFIDSFAEALRNELKDTGVTITTLMPGATETEFFARADMLDTKVGQSDKADPADVAKDGWEAMKAGQGHVVSGWSNKLTVAMAHVTPASMLAEQHRKMAEPGSGKE